VHLKAYLYSNNKHRETKHPTFAFCIMVVGEEEEEEEKEEEEK